MTESSRLSAPGDVDKPETDMGDTWGVTRAGSMHRS